MKILVTGANGFIGSEIIRKLSAEKFRILGLIKNASSVQTEYESIKSDIKDKNYLTNSLIDADFEVVIHCAGLAHQFGDIEKEKFVSVNVNGTQNIAEIAVKKNVKHFILISSTAVYGLQDSPMNENSDCRPGNAYAESKLEAEKICIEICEKNKIPLTIFRLAPVLGEKGVGNVPRLIEAIYRKRFLWVGNGQNKKSLIYAGDIADACAIILKNKRRGTEIFNLASQPVKMQKLVEIISEELKKPVPKFSIPEILPKLIFKINSNTFKLGFINKISQTFEKWLSEDIYPAEKIRQEYGFEPQTKIEDAVRKQCRWFLKNISK